VNVRDPNHLGITVDACAAALGVTRKQVLYAVTQGAPVIQRGGKGRGRNTLVDADAISAWLAKRGDFSLPYRLKLAERLTKSTARTTVALFRGVSGPHKLALGKGLLRQFIESDRAMREQLGLPALEPHQLPSEIGQIAKAVSIFARSVP
jgi:hypothetical protein